MVAIQEGSVRKVVVSLVFALMLAWTKLSGAATYYVQLAPGTPATSCAQAQNTSTPHDTIAEGVACLAAGDTLYLRGGTYTSPISLSSPTVKTGTANAWITVAGYPGETIILRPTTGTTNGLGAVRHRGNIAYVLLENFDVDGTNMGVGEGWQVRDGNHHITIRNVRIYNQMYNGLYIQGNDITVEDSVLRDNRSSPLCTNGLYYGIYVHDGNSVVLRRNQIYNNKSGGVHGYPGPMTGLTIEKNDIHNNNWCGPQFTSSFGGILIATDSSSTGNIVGTVINNNLIHHNGVDGNGGAGAAVRIQETTSASSVTGTLIYNNTIYANSSVAGAEKHGIVLGGQTTGAIVRNNLVVENPGGGILNGAVGSTLSHNRTTGTITDCAPSTSDLTQKVGSACIDAGTDVGYPYNGSAPDIGAFETFLFTSCEVPNTSASTIQIIFTSNANLLGSTLTTFTARRNASNNALTGAASKIGDTIVSLPLTTTYVGGDTADISWSSGGLTDNALIGGTLNQPFVQTLTNQSCTNNAGGAPSFTLTQATYKFHGVFGLEASPDIRSSEGLSSYSVVAGGAFRIRYSVTCGGADCDSTGFYLYYATGGGYLIVPDTFGVGNIAFCGTTYNDPLIPINGSATTNQLSTGGTFIPGGVIFSSNAIPTINGLNNGYKTELEYCVKFDTDATGSYTFRLYEQTGNALDTYSATPTVVVASPQSSGSH